MVYVLFSANIHGDANALPYILKPEDEIQYIFELNLVDMHCLN